MIGKIKGGELLATCEECGGEEAGGTLEFAEFVQYLKDAGWKIRKVDDEWTHTCPNCLED